MVAGPAGPAGAPLSSSSSPSPSPSPARPRPSPADVAATPASVRRPRRQDAGHATSDGPKDGLAALAGPPALAPSPSAASAPAFPASQASAGSDSAITHTEPISSASRINPSSTAAAAAAGSRTAGAVDRAAGGGSAATAPISLIPPAFSTPTPALTLSSLAPPSPSSLSSSPVFVTPTEDFEMDSLAPGGGGHRRRRSSLINPTAASTPNKRHSRSPRSSRASVIMNHATSATATGGGPQPGSQRISEEDNMDASGNANYDESAAGSWRSGRNERGVGRGDGGEDTDNSGGDSSTCAETDEDLRGDEETGLTARERARKKRRRRRNTRLDQRLVRGSSRTRVTAGDRRSRSGSKEATQSVLRSLAINGVFIGLWYFFSLTISLYNKWMFDRGRLNFPFPMFTTSLHMLVQFLLALTVLYFFPSLRPQHAHRRSQPRFGSDTEKPLMTKMFYLTRIGPCGAATSLDIGLGNTSLKFITLTFYTMCKSSSLAFVLLFAFLFRLETPTWRLVAIIATMTLGVIMMVAGEVEFRLNGFLLVISAAFFSGFRWGLTQILLLRNPATSNPFSSIFFLSPIMFLTLLVIAVPVEGVGALIDGIGVLGDDKGWLMTPVLLIFPGVIAFCMIASEFALLKRTSVVTLSIAGIFKEAITISAAALVFGDTMTPVNIFGLVTTLAAIGAYNYIKISKMQRDAEAAEHGSQRRTGARGRWGFSAVPSKDEDEDDEYLRAQQEGVVGTLREAEDVSSSAISGGSSPSTSGTDAEGGGGGGRSGSTRGGVSSSDEAGARRAAAKGKGKDCADAVRTTPLFTADGDTIPQPEPSPGLGIDGGVGVGGKSD